METMRELVLHRVPSLDLVLLREANTFLRKYLYFSRPDLD
jgi:hypothetical protein